MKTVFYPASERGHADHGWLKSHHSFSFADYYDPSKMRFGTLRVVNDDWIAGGQGFGTHPHENMEIVTIMVDGTLAHKDSMGNEFTISAGEVQRMSAGTGITHSEFNASKDKPAELFQIWVFPKEKGIKPSYEQKRFDPKETQGKFQFLVSPTGQNGSMTIHQDAWFSQARLDQSLDYKLHSPKLGLYLICVSGEIQVGSQKLGPKDAAGLTDFDQVKIEALKPAHVIALEVPMT